MAGVITNPEELRMQTFERGQLIVCASPYAHVISAKYNGEYCDFCCLPPSGGTRLHRCSACKYENYCNKTCQKKAWKYHKFECPLLKNVSPKVPSDSVRLLTKLVWNCANRINRPKNDPGWRVFTDLCSHDSEPEFRNDVVRQKQFMEISYTMHKYLGEQLSNLLSSPNDLLPIFGRMVYNGFTLVHLGIQIGAAIYISPSVFNHSCVPNAVFVNDGSTLNVRALRDIDTSKEAVVVNYIDPLQMKAKRQKELLEDYLFVCQCCKCTSTDDTELLFEALCCPFCQGRAIKRPQSVHTCMECLRDIEDPIYMNQVGEFISRAEELETKAQKTDINIREELMVLLAENVFLASSNIHISMLKGNLYAEESLYGSAEKAYALGEEMADIYKQHYPEYFTQFGTLHFRQARLAWHLDNYTQALNHYECALAHMKVTHGQDHHVFQTVSLEREECRRDKCIYETVGRSM